MNRIFFYSFVLFLTGTLLTPVVESAALPKHPGHAKTHNAKKAKPETSGLVEYIIGSTTGRFVKPRGERYMFVNGEGTNDFSWGRVSAGSPGDNSIRFRGGGGFREQSGQGFKIGSIDYYNGTTKKDSNAKVIVMKISMQFDDGPQVDVSVPIEFISTPNNRGHKENADVIKLGKFEGDNIVTINNKLYEVTFKFDNTSDFGFSDKPNEFSVFEGFEASADLRVMIFPYTPPAVPEIAAGTKKQIALPTNARKSGPPNPIKSSHGGGGGSGRPPPTLPSSKGDPYGKGHGAGGRGGKLPTDPGFGQISYLDDLFFSHFTKVTNGLRIKTIAGQTYQAQHTTDAERTWINIGQPLKGNGTTQELLYDIKVQLKDVRIKITQTR